MSGPGHSADCRGHGPVPRRAYVPAMADEADHGAQPGQPFFLPATAGQSRDGGSVSAEDLGGVPMCIL